MARPGGAKLYAASASGWRAGEDEAGNRYVIVVAVDFRNVVVQAGKP
jgi:hypothetical protein